MRVFILILLVIIYNPLIGQETDSCSLSCRLQGKLGCGIVTSNSKNKKLENSNNISFRCGISKSVSQIDPLYIVDGKVISPYKKAKLPHPDEIETKNVLNPDKAMAIYGSHGMEGALLIFTKKSTLKIIVMDIDSKQPIPKATISLSFLDKKTVNVFSQ